VITGLAIAIVVVVGWLRLRTMLDFAPFFVRVTPTRACLLDHSLATETQLQSLTNVAETSPLSRGVGFSLLRVGLLSEQGTLVYWNDWHSFSTDFETQVELTELRRFAPVVRTLPAPRAVAPAIYMKRARGGLEIGVVRWSDTGEQKTVAAILPWAVFDIRQWKSGHMSARKLARTLEMNGWTEEHGSSTCLTHKYLTVRWGYL